MRRGAMQPRGCVLRARGMEAVEVDEDLLRHVFRLVRVREHAVGYARDSSVFRCEKGLKRLFVRTLRRHVPQPEIYAHCITSTTGAGFVTSLPGRLRAPEQARSHLAQEG